jgi:hypothetical protein
VQHDLGLHVGDQRLDALVVGEVDDVLVLVGQRFFAFDSACS